MNIDHMIDGYTTLYGLFAHPAAHSLSPLMHNLSFQVRHINAAYLAFDIDSDISHAIDSIRLLHMGGVNLSMPLKQTALPYLDTLTAESRLIGAVNTIINKDGQLIGANTDGTGFFSYLRANHYEVRDKTATVLGAGGAGRSIIAAGAAAGLKIIHVFKRKNGTFAAAADKLKQFEEASKTRIRLHPYGDREQFRKAISASHFLINTTNVGMGSDRGMPLTAAQIDCLPSSVIVCDVIYAPRQTRFLQEAHRRGCVTINGLGMLIYQGAESFRLWTGQTMPVEHVEAAIKRKLYG
jgi:shikimate dehydrogenase